MFGWYLVGLAAAQQSGPPPVVLNPEPERPVFAREAKGLGIGAVLGIPTGLSVSFRPGKRVFYDGAFAWSFDAGVLQAQANVLLTLTELRTDEIPDVAFPVYLGLGPRARIGDSPFTTKTQEIAGVGLRVPVGMAFIHDGVPLEAFLELAPGVVLYPVQEPSFDVVIGGRYYLPGK